MEAPIEKEEEGKAETAKPPSPIQQLSDLTTLEHSLAALRQLLINNHKAVLEQDAEVGGMPNEVLALLVPHLRGSGEQTFVGTDGGIVV